MPTPLERMVLCQIAGDVLHLEDLGPLIEDVEHVLLLGGDEVHIVLDIEIGVIEDATQPAQYQQGEPQQGGSGAVESDQIPGHGRRLS
ncbi:hypothetical protein LA366_20935 [Aeromonas jandaei]|uniref:hypothetical protein n=1 Tax=Aeromonas jandaei TaxID=650 RepID=UPI001CE24E25|nr:hypothetical protein [Aeromonas jandaei]UCA33473.1 hypothetical protein LA366_20935 [Aeromonas jandaei]